MSESLEEAVKALEAVQAIDPQSIARTDALGQAMGFVDSVPTMSRIVALFNMLPAKQIIELPANQWKNIGAEGSSVITLYARIMEFNPNLSNNAGPDRAALIGELESKFEQSFNSLGPAVNFFAARDRDMSKLDAEVQEMLTRNNVEIIEHTASLAKTKEAAERILNDVRSLATKSGVSHQAEHFGSEATSHDGLAVTWQKYTVGAIVLLGVSALLAFAFGVLYEPKSTQQSIQIALGKLLVFTTLASLLYLCARTLLAHRHNAIVNKHRQNALLTFNALAEAASSEQTREVVLTHASACIFSPQESGFNKSSQHSMQSQALEVIPRIFPGQAA